jgi:enolase
MQIVGDDLLVSNTKRSRRDEETAVNSILIKVNQIGSTDRGRWKHREAQSAGFTP